LVPRTIRTEFQFERIISTLIVDNSDIKHLEIRAAIQDYPSAICAVWGCSATTAGSNYQTPCIREHWSAGSIVSPAVVYIHARRICTTGTTPRPLPPNRLARQRKWL